MREEISLSLSEWCGGPGEELATAAVVPASKDLRLDAKTAALLTEGLTDTGDAGGEESAAEAVYNPRGEEVAGRILGWY